MKTIALCLGLLTAVASHAAAPAAAPAGSTGLCKDGSYYDGAEKKGACRGHKGVQDWWGAAAAAPAVAAKPAAPAPAAPPAPVAPVAAAPAAKPAAAGKVPTQPSAITAAAGGGPGKVWVNESSKVYHCSGDKWYGKTKQGEYMTEADAKSKGFKGDHGKVCTG
jgi:hypothetical protein